MIEDKNTRIFKNTGLLYIRSFVCLLLSLYSSRLILQALGVEDFGIYNAVGGLASMFWMVSSTLSSAVGRFLNYEMGRENPQGVNEVFSLSFTIMILLAILAAGLAESLGTWFINRKMTIPPERMDVARLIFHLSVLTMVTGFLAIPFNAAIVAHERMGFVALVNIIEVVLKLGVAILLTLSIQNGDKLLYYSVLLAVITVLTHLSSTLFAGISFKECRFRLILKTKRLWEMLRFSFWNFIASITGTFSGQGVNMALNVYHGPALNTARGLTTTVSNAVSLLVYNFTIAVNPQITQSYAAGDKVRCRQLVFLGTRLAAFLMLFIVVPLCLETEFVLSIWLGSVPAHTVSFIRLSLISIFLNVFIYLFSVAKNATGNIRIYQLVISILSVFDFGLAWLFLHAGYQPEWIYLAPILVAVAKVIASVLFVKEDLGYRIQDVFHSIFLPVTLVTALSSIIPVALHLFMPQGWVRFIAVVFSGITGIALSACFIGCNREERKKAYKLARAFLRKSQRG